MADRSHGYDPACEDLARHFLGSDASAQRIAEVAQVIQDAIEDSITEEEANRG